MNVLIGWHTRKFNFFRLWSQDLVWKFVFSKWLFMTKATFSFFCICIYRWTFFFCSIHLCQQENSFLWRWFLECCYRNIIYCVNIKDELGSCCFEVEWNNLENLGMYFVIFEVFFVTGRYGVNSWIHRCTGCARGPFFQICYSNQAVFPFFWTTRAQDIHLLFKCEF